MKPIEDSTTAGEPEFDDPRLLEALREYNAALDAGRRPNRTAFLARHAAIADALAACLDGLDFVHTAAPELASGDGPANETAIDPEAPLGDYRIVRQVGHGGMGVVYEAVQLSLGRRVALKVLPFAATLDPKHLQRFRNEAQAAALLHHPHIVPVFAVGQERGVHFYAMQFIEGQTLAALIAGLRDQKKPKQPTPGTSTERVAGVVTERSSSGREFFRRVATLGVQAAEALEYAHQQGVIHRDVKPANLLLDGRGHLWVTDFGLARFQTDAGLTATGDLLGTLRYMSPEQASGRPAVDPTTDVYSLGATLYELLTLRPPFDGETREAILRHILHDDPATPRRLEPMIPADLETIVLKAMAKVPQERYASAQEMAEDLRRFLDDRPIHARRPTLVERGAKLARRHRGVVAGAVVLLVIALLGLLAATVRIAAERAKAEAAYEAEARQRQKAEANLARAREVLAFFTQVSEEDMADRPGMQDVRRKLLEKALRYYQEFIEEHRDDPAIRDELLASSWRVARILEEVGSRSDALAALEQLRRMEERMPRPGGPGPGPGGPGRGFPFPGGPPGVGLVFLLMQRPVQEDLQLTPEQVLSVGQLIERRPPRDPREWDEGERTRRLEETAAAERALADVLRAAQLRRLQQIVWQLRGTHALGDAEVASAVGLSGEQRETIRGLHEEATRKMWNFDGPFGPSQDRRHRSEEHWREVHERVLAVLTAEQQQKWREMKGEPFRGDIRFGPPPGGHGGPGGPRRSGG